MKLGIVGAGYVGLVAGACFAELGHEVICVDINKDKIANLEAGRIPIFEPGLEEYVKRNMAAGRLRFSSNIEDAANGNQMLFLAVGTPPSPIDGAADMTFFYNAIRMLAPHVEPGTIIVNKSTVPVTTGDTVEAIFAELRPGLDVVVASNPEFLREGNAIDDFMEPDRIVVGLPVNNLGEIHEKAQIRFDDLYHALINNSVPIVYTDRRTSEIIKYTANAFLAMKITFINEIADLCEAVSANVEDVTQGIGLDKRIGKLFLRPGPGFGGSCFPKDAQALAQVATKFGVNIAMVDTLIDSNQRRKRSMAERIIESANGNLKGKTVGILGLTFKPGTDDMRESPSIDIIEILQENGAHCKAYDPEGKEQALTILKDVEYCDNVENCAKGADILVLLTEWKEFQSLDLEKISNLMAGKTFHDFRNVFNPRRAREAGLDYHSIGRL